MALPSKNSSPPASAPPPAAHPETQLQIDSLVNLTTKTRIEKGKWLFGDGRPDLTKKDVSCTVTAIRDNGIILELPKNFAAGGHKARVTFHFKSKEKDFFFDVDGRIENVEHFREFPDRADFNFDVYDATAWKQVIDFYNENQAKVIALFERLKGTQE